MSWDRRLEAAFSPRAIAVVGASRKHRTVSAGERFVSILKSQGFPGQIYPVNPYATEIFGVKSYPDLKAVPVTPDLVIISVPAAEVKHILADCAAKGAKNIHIYASGFGETGIPDRRELEEELREIALREGLRIIGPNCMGLHIPSAHISTWDAEPSQIGNVSFLSQSGGHATDFTRYAREVYLGLCKVISFGNALVLDSTDFLEYLTTDRETQILCMYLEGVRNGKKLLQ
ncbi:CoA-binding protein, partial [Chloroflexota bacterium]